jgi:hypothetical protein
MSVVPQQLTLSSACSWLHCLSSSVGLGLLLDGSIVHDAAGDNRTALKLMILRFINTVSINTASTNAASINTISTNAISINAVTRAAPYAHKVCLQDQLGLHKVLPHKMLPQGTRHQKLPHPRELVYSQSTSHMQGVQL